MASATSTTATAVPIQLISSQRFKVLNLIGRGGFGKVYLAEDTSRFQQVALKCLDVSEKLTDK